MERRQQFFDAELLTFDMLALIKGCFPSRMKQFCTEILKLRPQARWLRENLTDKGIDFVRYAGVRCDESGPRKDTPESKWDDMCGCTVYYPIRCWSKIEVFAYLKHFGETPNPLYKMGFGRVGCAPCVNSGKEDIRGWAARFPAMIDKIRLWEERVGRTYFAPCVPGLEINWIDQVVAWAHTSHGGKQGLLMFERQTPPLMRAARNTAFASERNPRLTPFLLPLLVAPEIATMNT